MDKKKLWFHNKYRSFGIILKQNIGVFQLKIVLFTGTYTNNSYLYTNCFYNNQCLKCLP